MGTERNDFVSASEIASWAWCPEAWRLDALGEDPDNRAALIDGHVLHDEKSAFEVSSRRTAVVGMSLVAIALITATVLYFICGGAG